MMRARYDLKNLPDVTMSRLGSFVILIAVLFVMLGLPCALLLEVFEKGWIFDFTETFGMLLGYPLSFVVFFETLEKMYRTVIEFKVELKIVKGDKDYEQFYIHNGDGRIEVSKKMYDKINIGDTCYLIVRSKELEKGTPTALKLVDTDKVEKYLHEKGNHVEKRA